MILYPCLPGGCSSCSRDNAHHVHHLVHPVVLLGVPVGGLRHRRITVCHLCVPISICTLASWWQDLWLWRQQGAQGLQHCLLQAAFSLHWLGVTVPGQQEFRLGRQQTAAAVCYSKLPALACSSDPKMYGLCLVSARTPAAASADGHRDRAETCYRGEAAAPGARRPPPCSSRTGA